MQKKILKNLIIVSAFGIVLATVALFIIQTSMAHSRADSTTRARLGDVMERMEKNELQIADLMETLKDDYLSRARALALMIELEPDIIKSRDKLDEVVSALNVDEIHIIDENGILCWGTQPQYYGMDFATTDQTRPFLQILGDPGLEIAQDLMPNGSSGLLRQYSGVALRNQKGIAQVGMYPNRLDEALKNNDICNVLSDIVVGNNGYVMSIDGETGVILSHPNLQLIGTVLELPQSDTGFMMVNNERMRYATLRFDSQLLTAVMPDYEVYSQRMFYTMVFMCFMIAVFGAVSVILNAYIRRNMVNGILSTVSILEKISSGNLDVSADVRSNAEFEKLSDGINHMVLNIKTKMEKIAAQADDIRRYSAIIASSGSGVIIKGKDGIITDWNSGAEKILGYTPDDVLGRTASVYKTPERIEKTKPAYERVLNGEPIVYTEDEFIHKDGRSIICSTSVSPVYGPDNSIDGMVTIFHDITAEKSAEKSAKKLAAIIAIADAGIIIKDKDGTVAEWNIGAENILGYKPHEIVGKTSKCYAPDGGHAEIDEIERRLKQGEHTAHVEVIRKHKDGRLIDCSASYTPIYDEDGNFSGSVAIFHDISDKKQMEHALKDALAAAEDASRAKSSFLANMSHEIRTPMNGVIGFTELALYEEGISPKARDYLTKIKESADGLLGIISDILDLSKIEAGRVELENTAFSLHSVLKQCETICNVRAQEKGLLLYVYSDLQVSKRLMGDPTRLRQVLLNLLSNAIKFTEHGSVKLITSFHRLDDNRVEIIFDVKDSGMGMPPEQLEKIFDPFAQGDSSTTRKYGGTGLGLAITKNLVELMGGKLNAESTPGAGSKFSFSLVFEMIGTHAEPESGSAANGFDMKKPMFSGSVLVCEDNVINQQVIVEHLSHIGLNATVAGNGKLGVEAVQAALASGNGFDLVLMDVHMPVMDGIEASKKLAELGNTAPIIALTANAMTKDKEVYLKSGMSDYLAKPFTAHALWTCLLKYLEPVTLEPDKTPPDTIALAGGEVINRRLGIEQVSGNAELYEHLLADFVKENQTTFERLSSAIDSGNINTAHRIAHTLKGVAGLLGACGLRKAAECVEKALSVEKCTITGVQLQTLKRALDAVLTELAPLLPQENRSPMGKLDREKAAEVIAKLEPLLKSGDSKSLKMLGEARSALAPLGDSAYELAEQIEDYDFDLALASLYDIKKALAAIHES